MSTYGTDDSQTMFRSFSVISKGRHTHPHSRSSKDL